MTTFKAFLFAATAITTALGCASMTTNPDALNSGDESNTQESEQGIFLPPDVQLFTKNNNVVPVCWYTSGYAKEKGIIQHAVWQTWERAANIKFTWRDSCPTTGNEKFVKVQMRAAPGEIMAGGRSSVGMAALTAPSYVMPAVDKEETGTGVTFWVEPNGNSNQPRLEHVAVHEFGHVLGIIHEQNRPEAEARECKDNSSVEPGTTVGPYDRDSIMNYCTSTGNAIGVLSEVDIWGARELYGFKDDHPNLFADLNGDGKADAIAPNSDAVYIMTSTGNQLSNWGRAWDPFYGSRETLAGDIDGDRRADLIAINNGGVFTISSSGSQFGNWKQAYGSPFYGSRKTLAGDVNGDGRTDLIAVNFGALFVALAQGNGFVHAGQWSQTPIYGSLGTHAGDVNGDGRADIIAVNGNGIGVALSNGNSFATPQRWHGNFWGALATAFADVNGDGRVDAIAVNHDVILVGLSTGTSFAPYTAWTSMPFYGTRDTRFADVDGDGKADAIAVNNKGDFVMKSNGSQFIWSGEWSIPFFAQPW